MIAIIYKCRYAVSNVNSHLYSLYCCRYATILAFDVKVERDAQELADSLGVKIFQADIIYHLFNHFMAYRDELKQKKREEFRSIAVFPCKLKVSNVIWTFLLFVRSLIPFIRSAHRIFFVCSFVCFVHWHTACRNGVHKSWLLYATPFCRYRQAMFHSFKQIRNCRQIAGNQMHLKCRTWFFPPSVFNSLFNLTNFPLLFIRFMRAESRCIYAFISIRTIGFAWNYSCLLFFKIYFSILMFFQFE